MAKTDSKASRKVGQVMHEFKEGTLKSSSGETVKNPKQAVAIGLSEARQEGDQVPPAKTAGPARKAPGTKTAKR